MVRSVRSNVVSRRCLSDIVPCDKCESVGVGDSMKSSSGLRAIVFKSGNVSRMGKGSLGKFHASHLSRDIATHTWRDELYDDHVAGSCHHQELCSISSLQISRRH